MTGLIISAPGIHHILTTHLPDEVHIISDRAQRQFAVEVFRLFPSPEVSFAGHKKEDYSLCKVNTFINIGVL